MVEQNITHCKGVIRGYVFLTHCTATSAGDGLQARCSLIFHFVPSTHLKVFFTEISFINHINLSGNNLVTDTANMAYCLENLYLNNFKDGKFIFHLKILFTDWLVFISEISVA